MWTAKGVQSVQEEFVRAIFSQLRCGAEDYQWDLHALAFEASVNVKRLGLICCDRQVY